MGTELHAELKSSGVTRPAPIEREKKKKRTTHEMLMVTKHLLFHVHKKFGLWLEIVVQLAHSSNRNSIGAGEMETEELRSAESRKNRNNKN